MTSPLATSFGPPGPSLPPPHTKPTYYWIAPPQGSLPAPVAARAWYWLCQWAANPPLGATNAIEWIVTGMPGEGPHGTAYLFRWIPTLGKSGPLVPGSPPPNWPAVQALQWAPSSAPSFGPLPPHFGVSPMPFYP